MNLLIGADPELFVKRAGEFLSGFNLIPGTKRKPHRVDKGAVQVDGMALEFNIDPANTEDQFLDHVNNVVAQLAQMIPEYELEAVPVVEFGSEYIKAQPIEAQELGCDPDYNAYTGKQNPIPDAEKPIRTGAGHIHVGWGEGFRVKSRPHRDMCRDVVRQLDVALGLPSLLFDKHDERRELYGQAGAFRPKSYGCEYRVLSNAWTRDPKLIRWAFRSTKLAVEDVFAGKFYTSPEEATVQEIINNSDREAAVAFLKQRKLTHFMEGLE